MEEKHKFKYLLKNTLLLTISSFSSKLLAFFLVPLYTNVLSTTEYGIADLISTSAALMMYVLTLNIGTAVLRYGIEAKDRHDRVFIYAMRILAAGTFVMAAGAFVLFYFRILEWPVFCYPCLVLAFFADSFETIMFSYLRAVDKVKHMAIGGIIDTITKIFTNILTLLVWKLGLVGFLAAMIIGPVSGGIYSLCAVLPLHRSEKDPEYERQLHREMRQFAIPTIFVQLAWWINNSLDKYFVTAIKGVSVNGIYAVSYKIPGIMAMLCNIFGQAWGISAIKELDPDDSDGFFASTYRVFNAALVMSCSGLILINIPMSRVMYAKDFFAAWQYSSMLILAMLFSGLGTFFGGIFTAVKKSKTLAYTTMLGAGVNIILNALLIPRYSAGGAAVATMISFYTVWLSRLIASRQFVSVRINLLRDHVVYALIIAQILIEHFESHMYWGQILIFVLIVALNHREFMLVLDSLKGILKRFGNRQ